MAFAESLGFDRLLVLNMLPGDAAIRSEAGMRVLAAAVGRSEGWGQDASTSSRQTAGRRFTMVSARPVFTSASRGPTDGRWYAQKQSRPPKPMVNATKAARTTAAAATSSSSSSGTQAGKPTSEQRNFRSTGAWRCASAVAMPKRPAVTARWLSALAIALRAPNVELPHADASTTPANEMPGVSASTATVLSRPRESTWGVALGGCLEAWPQRGTWGAQASHVDNALLYCRMYAEALQFGTPLAALIRRANQENKNVAGAIALAATRQMRDLSSSDAAAVILALPGAHAAKAVNVHRLQLLQGAAFSVSFYRTALRHFAATDRWDAALGILGAVHMEVGASAAMAGVQAVIRDREACAVALVSLQSCSSVVEAVRLASVLGRAGKWEAALAAVEHSPNARLKHAVGCTLQREGVKAWAQARLVDPERIRPSTLRQRRQRALLDRHNQR
jgi:hypothetical protein